MGESHERNYQMFCNISNGNPLRLRRSILCNVYCYESFPMKPFEEFFTEYCNKHLIPLKSPYRISLHETMKEAYEVAWADGYSTGSRDAKSVTDDPYKSY